MAPAQRHQRRLAVRRLSAAQQLDSIRKGVIYSKVSGGMANGFVRDDNLAISAGTRLRF